MNDLNKYTKAQLIELLKQSNHRRKREVLKWKKEAEFYTRKFIDQRNAQWDTCAKFSAYVAEVRGRESELKKRENEYLQWRNNVDALVRKENDMFKTMYSLQQCSCCSEKRWRRKYRQSYSGMSEFCGKYIHIVDDMLRQKRLPDNVKAHLVDMRVAFLESREFLNKILNQEEE